MVEVGNLLQRLTLYLIDLRFIVGFVHRHTVKSGNLRLLLFLILRLECGQYTFAGVSASDAAAFFTSTAGCSTRRSRDESYGVFLGCYLVVECGNLLLQIYPAAYLGTRIFYSYLSDY